MIHTLFLFVKLFNLLLFIIFTLCFLQNNISIAKEKNAQFAIGIPAGSNNFGNSISIKYIHNNSLIFQIIFKKEYEKKETQLFIEKEDRSSIELRLFRNRINNKLNTYYGIGYSKEKEKKEGIDRTTDEKSKVKINIYKTSIITGIEYLVLKNLGISAEVGYYFEKEKLPNNETITKNGTYSALFGMHYYF